MENHGPLIPVFRVERGERHQRYKSSGQVAAELRGSFDRLLNQAQTLVASNRFFIQSESRGARVTARGGISADRSWQVEHLSVTRDRETRDYRRLDEVPEPYASQLKQWVANQGVERVRLVR